MGIKCLENFTIKMSQIMFLKQSLKKSLFRLLPMAKRCAEHNVEKSREFEVMS